LFFCRKDPGWFKIEFGDFGVVGGTDVDGKSFMVAEWKKVDIEDVKQKGERNGVAQKARPKNRVFYPNLNFCQKFF